MRKKNTFKNMKISFMFFFIVLIFNFISRSFFLKILGTNITGFNNLIGSLLVFLNVAELGVGSAITYALYNPLKNSNYKKINEIMILFKYYYERIGKLVFLLGIILSFLLKFFVKNQLPLGEALFYYYLLLFSSAISYFFTYKQTLIIADQKQYVITIIMNICKITKISLQIIILAITKSYFYWIVLEIIFNMISLIIISRKVDKSYPEVSFKSLKTIIEIKQENLMIIKNIKDVFFHKIATFIVYQTDSILISLFLNFNQNTIYGNYILVINSFLGLFNTVMGSFKASIGNLIAEDNNLKSYNIFKQLYIVDNIIALIVSFTLYNTINDFMILWVGEEYLFSKNILLVFSINLYIQISRGSIERFKESYGLFWDRWAPIFEGAVNIIISLILVNYIGILGLLIGTLISNILVVIIWKPYILYRYGFHKSVNEYLCLFLKVIISNIFILNISSFILGKNIEIIQISSKNILGFLVSSTWCFIIVTISTIMIFLNSKNFRCLIKSLINRS